MCVYGFFILFLWVCSRACVARARGACVGKKSTRGEQIKRNPTVCEVVTFFQFFFLIWSTACWQTQVPALLSSGINNHRYIIYIYTIRNVLCMGLYVCVMCINAGRHAVKKKKQKTETSNFLLYSIFFCHRYPST